MSENQCIDDEDDPEVNEMRQGFRGKRGNLRGNRPMRQRGGYRNFDPRGGRKRHACFNCDSKEHWARDYPEPQENEKTKRHRQEYKPHEVEFCQAKARKTSEEEEIFAVSIGNDFSGSVIFNSGASKSVIGRQTDADIEQM